MAGNVSKRQQARNEKVLQELLRTVPGNEKCADCAAKNPGWASWSLGIFLCMSCAALHRKMGTHISKVKSLSMDSWANDQVENMKRVGNATSNRNFNPNNVRAYIPVDVDEAGGAMERFIRQKYEFRAFSGGNARQAARQNTGGTSTSSQEDQPPPLPPKPGKRFGFSLRSASATYSRPSRMDKFTPPLSPALSGSDGRQTPPKMMNKASRVFGSAVGNQEDNFDEKLASLREMGFSDARRNSIVLKSMDGNLDRAVETLVRMGESSKTPSRALTPVSASSTSASGLTVERKRAVEPAKQLSSNPWDALDEPPKRAFTQPLPQIPQHEAFQQQPQQQQQQQQQQQASYNPFLQGPAQNQQLPQGLQDSFQGLQISNGYQQQAYQQNANSAPMTGQNPFMALNQYSQPQGTTYASMNNPYNQPAQPSQQPQQPSNPFLRHTKSQTFTPSNPWAQTSAFATNSQNPWLSQPQVQTPQATSPAPLYPSAPDFFSTQPAQTQQYQLQEMQQHQMVQQAQPYQMTNPPQQNGNNPFYMQNQVPPSASYNPYQTQQAQAQQSQQNAYQQILPQQTRHDKTSIMALYNYPQIAPSRPLGALPEDSVPSMSGPGANGGMQAQRSVTMPISASGSMNPFLQGPTSGQNQMNGVRHASQESQDFMGLGGNGRHSPDAFSGLSARYAH